MAGRQELAPLQPIASGRALPRPERAVARGSSFCMLEAAIFETLTDVISRQKKSPGSPGGRPSVDVRPYQCLLSNIDGRQGAADPAMLYFDRMVPLVTDIRAWVTMSIAAPATHPGWGRTIRAGS